MGPWPYWFTGAPELTRAVQRKRRLAVSFILVAETAQHSKPKGPL